MGVQVGDFVLFDLLSKLDGMKQFELISMDLEKLRLVLVQETFRRRDMTVLDQIDP